MRTNKCGVGIVMALLLGALGLGGLRAQDGIDQQQWWNPADWADNQSAYNLFSDNYWENRYSDTADAGYDLDWDRGFEDTWDYDSDYGYYDGWDYDSEYGDYDAWDSDSEFGYDSSWDEDASAVGTAGDYESGSDFGADE